MNKSGKLLRAIFALAIVSGMTGCWDSGDPATSTAETPTPPAAPAVSTASAEGVYGGAAGSEGGFDMLVLETGEFWYFFGSPGANHFTVNGFARGKGVSDKGTFTSLWGKYFNYADSAVATMVATYDAAAKTISGTESTTGADPVAFSGGPIADSTYDYSVPASLSDIAGSSGRYWYLWDRSGAWFSVYVAASGEVSATQIAGGGTCQFSGSVTPRPSGKNVFNLLLSFPATGCSLSNAGLDGVALVISVNGHPQLLMAATDDALQKATWLYGSQND